MDYWRVCDKAAQTWTAEKWLCPTSACSSLEQCANSLVPVYRMRKLLWAASICCCRGTGGLHSWSYHRRRRWRGIKQGDGDISRYAFQKGCLSLLSISQVKLYSFLALRRFYIPLFFSVLIGMLDAWGRLIATNCWTVCPEHLDWSGQIGAKISSPHSFLSFFLTGCSSLSH